MATNKFHGTKKGEEEGKKWERSSVEQALDYYVFPANRLNIFGCKVNFMPSFSWKRYPVGR